MTIRKTMLAPAAAWLAASWSGAAAAEGSAGIHVTIDRQGLEPALHALWKRTELEYKLPAGDAWLNARTKAIDDEFATAEAALREMLECSGFGYRWLDYPRKVSIVPAEEAPTGKACLRIISNSLQEPEPEILASEDGERPYVVLDRKQIAHRQALSASDLARDAIVGGGAGWGGGPVPGSSAPNPVAIAARRTLIDGYELPAFFSGAAAVPAISGLPLSAIERVEVYPETYFGAGGGSSGSKTINFVVSRRCEAPLLSVDLGNSFASGAGLRRAYGSLCETFADTELQMKAAMSDQHPLLVGDRDYVRSMRTAMLAGDSSVVFSRTTPWLSDKVNVRFLDAEGPASVTTLSRADIETKNVEAASANAGTVSTTLANSAQADGGSRASMLNGEKTYYLDTRVRQRFSDTVSARLGFVTSKTTTRTSMSVADAMGLQSVYVPAQAPGNFFRRNLIASIPLEGLDFDLERELTTRHFTVRFNYRPDADTRASVDLFTGTSTFGWSQPTASGAAEAIASGAVDAFTLDKITAQQWVQEYYSPSQVSRSWQVRTKFEKRFAITGRSSLRVMGRLERGESDFQGGVELMRGSSDPLPRTIATLSRQTQTADGALLQVAYALRSSYDGPLLDVRLAGRADRYTKLTNDQRCVPTCPTDSAPDRTVYRSVNPAIDVRFQATKDWAFGASFSEGVRVPSSEEVGGSTMRAVPVSLFRGLQGAAPDAIALAVAGGNPGVGPEELRSWSAGVEYSPSFAPSFTVTVSYMNVRKQNEIVVPTEMAYSDFALFASTYAGSIQSLVPAENVFGASVGLDLTARNIAEAESRALEGTIRYLWVSSRGFEIGISSQLHSQLLLRRRASPTSPWNDNTGLTAYSPSCLAWTSDITFARGPLEVALISRYLGDYRFTSAEEIQAQGARNVSSRLYEDLHVSYRFGAAGRSRIETELQLGISNLLNTSPRRDTSQRYAISPQDDPRLRSFLLSAIVHF